MATSRFTTIDLARARARWSTSPGLKPQTKKAAGGKGLNRLIEISDFGPNPGSLTMLAYAPKDLPTGAPLVVVLHGCTQSAAGYDEHAGWTRLADERCFAVVYPEQKRANNPANCFNWFQIADMSRGLGESRSIRDMVETMATRHGSDRSRIFVTGLSAGAAMAAALLADYPEVFAAGALIAGLPCGAAANMHEALEAMKRPREKSAAQLGDLVRAGSQHEGPWPRVSIWHGSADATVTPKNADALVTQWLDVHGADPRAFRDDRLEGHNRRTWSADGRDVVEFVSVAGMGHGTPLDGRLGERPGPFMLEAGVSSTRHIAEFFGIAQGKTAASKSADAATRPTITQAAEAAETPAGVASSNATLALEHAAGPKHARRSDSDAERKQAKAEPAWTSARFGATGPSDVGTVITKALRAAGLMK